MEKRIITVLLQAAFVLSLLYACYLFNMRQRYDPQAFMTFVPPLILLVSNVVYNLLADLMGAKSIGFLSDMDPLTTFFLFVAALMMLIGVFMQEERFNQVLGWSFSLATFVAGWEAGKVRERTAPKKRRMAARRSREKRIKDADSSEETVRV